MAISHVTDYVESGLALLPQQYKGKPRIEAWLTTYLTCFQGIEDCAWELFTDRLIQNNPTGDLLAKLGIIVGQTSLGYTDSVFKLLIRARIMTNRSTGQKKNMVRIARALGWDGAVYPTVVSYSLQPAFFYMQIYAIPTVPSSVMFSQFLYRAIGAGIALALVTSGVAKSGWLMPISAHASNFAAGPVPSGGLATSAQWPGSAHHGGFAAGPIPSGAGGGTFAHVNQG